jgi:hypothetical protein
VQLPPPWQRLRQPAAVAVALFALAAVLTAIPPIIKALRDR